MPTGGTFRQGCNYCLFKRKREREADSEFEINVQELRRKGSRGYTYIHTDIHTSALGSLCSWRLSNVGRGVFGKARGERSSREILVPAAVLNTARPMYLKRLPRRLEKGGDGFLRVLFWRSLSNV